MAYLSVLKPALLVALGGAVGSVARWGLARALDRWGGVGGVGPGIVVVNVLGCLLIGVVLGTTSRGEPVVGSAGWRLLLATGVCGGFTTFSTFSQQTLELVAQGRGGVALAYAGLSVGLGLGATTVGWWICRL